MKFETGRKIVIAAPYVTSILAGAAAFALMSLYGRFCEEFGMDNGIEGTLEAMENVSPKLKEEILESANKPPMRFHR